MCVCPVVEQLAWHTLTLLHRGTQSVPFWVKENLGVAVKSFPGSMVREAYQICDAGFNLFYDRSLSFNENLVATGEKWTVQKCCSSSCVLKTPSWTLGFGNTDWLLFFISASWSCMHSQWTSFVPCINCTPLIVEKCVGVYFLKCFSALI